jgi:serine/threonine-protein kinase RsbW
MDIRLPADLHQLSLIRSVLATIVQRERFDSDTVEDLKLVVDEMCSVLVDQCARTGTLTCSVAVVNGCLTLVATAPSDSDSGVDRGSLGWRVLAALTDSAFTWTTPDGAARYQVHIRANRARDTLLAG